MICDDYEPDSHQRNAGCWCQRRPRLDRLHEQWLRIVRLPPKLDSNWTGSGAFLEHLRGGSPSCERENDGRVFDVVVTNGKGEQECIPWM